MRSLPPAKAAVAAGILGNSIFGLSFLFSKIALAHMAPLPFLSLRFLVAFLFMNLLLLLRVFSIDWKKPGKWKLLALGLFQPVLYFPLESYGILYTNASFSAVMIALVPITSMIYGALFLQEFPSRRQVCAASLSILGIVLLSLEQESAGAIRPLGIVILLGAVLAATGFNVLSKETGRQFTAFERTYGMFFLGSAVFTAAAAGTEGGFAYLRAALETPDVLLSVAYLGIISSVVAFLCLNYANQHLPLARAASFANLATVLPVLAGVLILHEPFSPMMVPAALLVLAGIWGVQKKEV